MIRLMAGGTLDHSTIGGNLFAALRSRLQGGPCRVFGEGAKVTTPQASMYPDVVVTCARFDPKSTVVPEPKLVVEVLSRSTEDFDRGRKWVHYQELDSLRYYVLVSQDEVRVEVYARGDQEWGYTVLTALGDTLRIADIHVELPLAEIYEGSSPATASS